MDEVEFLKNFLAYKIDKYKHHVSHQQVFSEGDSKNDCERKLIIYQSDFDDCNDNEVLLFCPLVKFNFLILIPNPMLHRRILS
jgi:hypothetical protein